MKKLLIIIFILFLTSCWNNINNNSKSNKVQKYSYEELLDVFAISWNVCRWDVLYKWNRFKITKDYSDYIFGTFQPSLEEQKKYNELTKNKIYWDENPLDFLARNEMYCLWNFYNWSDDFSENINKNIYLEKYYNENKESNNILKIFENPKEIDLEKLNKILKYWEKINSFYKELKNINQNISIEKIYINLKTKEEKKVFLKIIDNIAKYTNSEKVFNEIIDFYKNNNLLKIKKESLLKHLKYKEKNIIIDLFNNFSYVRIKKKLENIK